MMCLPVGRFTTSHVTLSLNLPLISSSIAALKSGHCLSLRASAKLRGTGMPPTSLTRSA